MEPARSTGNFSWRITSADGNGIIAILDLTQVNAKYEVFKQSHLVEVQALLEDLKVTVNLPSLVPPPFPNINALMSDSDKQAEIMKIRDQGQKISLGLYIAKGNGAWQYESEVVFQNYGGAEHHVPILVPFLSSNETLLMGGDFKLGVKIETKWQQPLKASDFLLVKGTYRQIVSFSELLTINKLSGAEDEMRIIGEIVAHGSLNTPNKWLPCDGSSRPIAAYPKLYEALGTSWGPLTNGNANFQLPDLRGKTLIGAGTGAGLTARAIGQSLGAESHTLNETQMPVHSHVQAAHNHIQDVHNHLQNPHSHNYNWFAPPNAVNGLSVAAGSLSAQANIAVSVAATATNQAATATNQAATATNQVTGGGAAHNNMQPSAVINYIVFAG